MTKKCWFHKLESFSSCTLCWPPFPRFSHGSRIYEEDAYLNSVYTEPRWQFDLDRKSHSLIVMHRVLGTEWILSSRHHCGGNMIHPCFFSRVRGCRSVSQGQASSGNYIPCLVMTLKSETLYAYDECLSSSSFQSCSSHWLKWNSNLTKWPKSAFSCTNMLLILHQSLAQ